MRIHVTPKAKDNPPYYFQIETMADFFRKHKIAFGVGAGVVLVLAAIAVVVSLQAFVAVVVFTNVETKVKVEAVDCSATSVADIKSREVTVKPGRHTVRMMMMAVPKEMNITVVPMVTEDQNILPIVQLMEVYHRNMLRRVDLKSPDPLPMLKANTAFRIPADKAGC